MPVCITHGTSAAGVGASTPAGARVVRWLRVKRVHARAACEEPHM